VIAKTYSTPEDIQFSLQNNIYITYSTKRRILDAINSSQLDSNPVLNKVLSLLNEGKITWEQAVLAVDNSVFVPNILDYMGIAIKETQ